MRIAELLRWVAESAGSAGWPSREPSSDTARRAGRVAILGGNLAGWTCASYLALTGCQADIFDSRAGIPAELEAAQDEAAALHSLGVNFRGGQEPGQVDVTQYDAVYLASDEWAGSGTEPVSAGGKLFTAPTGVDSLPAAEAVAEGRRAAAAISADR